MSALSMEDINIIMKNASKDDGWEVLLSENEESRNISGFLSATSKLCIKYKSGNTIEEIPIFLKRIPKATYHRELIIDIGAFEREVNIYNKFLNNFVEFIPDASFPFCYLARSNDLIVLEDLSHKGFKTVNINETYGLQHCEKAIEAICKLHAASILFEIRKNRKITHILPSLEKPAVINLEVDVDKKFYATSIKALKTLIKHYVSGYSEEIIEKAFKYFEVMPNELGPSEKYLNVLTHGDVWGNNIMFNYESDNEVSKAYLIDFQLSSYTTPAFDLLMLLHNCTTSKFRKQHFKYLIKYYYSQLFYLLSIRNFNLESIMPWSDFEETVNESIPHLLAIANICIPFALMPEDILKEILPYDEKFKNYLEEDRDSYVLKASEKSSIYKNRVLDTITAFLDYFKYQ